MEDYYEILGVQRLATEADIKSAYRKLAMKHHPDRGGDTAKFQQITEAYNTLSDPDKRRAYDNPAPQFEFNGGPFSDGNHPFGDMFRDFFGQQHRAQSARHSNQNVRIRITIPLWDMIRGCTKYITLSYSRAGKQEISIELPPGIESGATIKYAGLGDDFNEKLPRGDLYVIVVAEPHPTFMPAGHDLYTNFTISAWDAVLGSKIQMTCIDSNVIEVTVPPGIQPGGKLRCVGHGGYDTVRQCRGDLYITVNVSIPRHLTEEQKQTIQGWK